MINFNLTKTSIFSLPAILKDVINFTQKIDCKGGDGACQFTTPRIKGILKQIEAGSINKASEYIENLTTNVEEPELDWNKDQRDLLLDFIINRSSGYLFSAMQTKILLLQTQTNFEKMRVYLERINSLLEKQQQNPEVNYSKDITLLQEELIKL